jgi:glycosyltransferase involved in cell wall biosynthesis
MNLNSITPLIIVHNEVDNITRTLEPLSWARRIVIVDSGSTDGTLEILARYAAVEVFHRTFDSFAAQCNFGLKHIETPWVLSLDADYVLSDDLVSEIKACPDDPVISGFSAAFVYRVCGRALRANLYPRRTMLYRAAGAAYAEQGHGHRVRREGQIVPLRHVIYHDDRKPIVRWFASQQRYAEAEADYLLQTSPVELSRSDRIRLLAWPAPFLVFFYTLFAKRCIFDGWAGWIYVLQRTCAEIMIALSILDRRLKS